MRVFNLPPKRVKYKETLDVDKVISYLKTRPPLKIAYNEVSQVDGIITQAAIVQFLKLLILKKSKKRFDFLSFAI